MNTLTLLYIGLFVALLIGLAIPLGAAIARVYAERPTWAWEQPWYRLLGVDPAREMHWREYAAALLLSNALGGIAVFGLQLGQGPLPLNPQHLGGVEWTSALNTAISFTTNTNWQGYSGEVTLSYLTQMLGLGVQNFVSAASGMAVLVALIRGLTRRTAQTIGNFWVDLSRSILYILLPLSMILALALVSQGVVQSFAPAQQVPLLQAVVNADGSRVTEQFLPLGPAASQIAIKQLGTNGGGYFNTNSAHPFENPTPLSNWLELLAILLIPAALCFSFGHMVGDRRQGWALFAAMGLIFLPLLGLSLSSEQAGNPLLTQLGVDQTASALQSGGNMEGKEVRFGIGGSVLWAIATTAASNGSVNAMHASFTPLGGFGPLFLIQLGEVVFGGVGSGLYGMLVFALIAVFIAGLMVGRTPEYLGKKIEAFEIKMAALVILLPCATVLIGAAVAVSVPAGQQGVFNPSAHGFSEVLYAFSSAGNNNGSAFAGLAANTPFYNLSLGVAMLLGRYGVALPILALAGSLAAKRSIPASAGTLPTHTPLFVGLLVGVVLIVGALTFLPALALGPLVEQIKLWS